MKYSDGDLALIVLDSLQGFEYKHKIKLISLVSKREVLFDCPKPVKDYLYECVGEAKARTVISALTEAGFEKITPCAFFGGEIKPDTERIEIVAEKRKK